MEIDEFKNELLPLTGNERTKFFREYLKSYVYIYCEIDEDNRRLPIYIGKGKSDRCFAHLNNLNDLSISKNKRIKNLVDENKLDIDILAYDIDEKTALSIESACIDLMGIDNLVNKVRGHGNNIKRVPIKELSNIFSFEKMNKKVKILPEHKGVAILINKFYRPTFGDLEIFEFTRGFWTKGDVTTSRKSKEGNVKKKEYAYATFKGVVKEVYETHNWVPAGTQEYFFRTVDLKKINTAKYEFVGRKAPDELRKEYVGKMLDIKRSYGRSFVRV